MFFGSKVEKNIKTGGCINPGVLSGGKSYQARKLFSQAQRIFKEASPKKLCSLVECKTYGPSEVLAIIPEATSEQLANFFDVLEESRSCNTSDRPSIVVGQVEKDLVKEAKAVDSSAGRLSNLKNEKNVQFSFSDDFEKKLLLVLGASNHTVSDADVCKLTYDRLRQNPLDRSRLENLHTARAHKYGMAHLGPKNWYKESPNLLKKLKSLSERRKFRAGLKGNIDFLNQLNMLDFEECFKAGTSDGLEELKLHDPVLTDELKNKLKGIPPIELVKFVKEEKASKLLQFFEKIKSYAHFSQSMTDYFGHTDALEPAFGVFNQVLRQNENIGVVLKDRHTTFLGLAQSFQVNPHIDRDGEGKQKEKLTFSRYKRQSSDRDVARLRKRIRPYNQGFCYDFQKKSFCSKRHCALKHQCAICRSKRHGKAACSR